MNSDEYVLRIVLDVEGKQNMPP